MKTTTGGRYSHHVWEYPGFQSAEVIDPLTVKLNFTDTAPTFKILPDGDLPMVPKHIWEPIGNYTKMLLRAATDVGRLELATSEDRTCLRSPVSTTSASP